MEIQAKIRNYALKLLTGRMYASAELGKKLVQKFPDDKEQFPEILKELTRGKILNDQVYAETYVRFRQETAPRGKFALRMELQRKGIPSAIISKVLEEISDESEEDQLQGLLKKKLSTFSSNLSKEQKKEKIFRFLTARGFSQGMIFRVLEKEFS